MGRRFYQHSPVIGLGLFFGALPSLDTGYKKINGTKLWYNSDIPIQTRDLYVP